jgi:anhydro-N-acetylmuramic acid kinase
VRVIGLMSGTSHDAVDAAAADLTLDGDTLRLAPLGMIAVPYPPELRAALVAALPPAATTMAEVCRLDTRIGQAFAAVADRADRELCRGRAELVVSHGQTVHHWAEGGRVHGTLQLGRPAWIAERTGRPVVADLRAADVAAGGQGAPLVAAVDVLWLRGRPGVPVALNLGGIANVTVAAGPRGPLAFDTGPANALLDAAVHHLTGGRADRDTDGALAARGTVHPGLLRRLLAEPYYALAPPKTTGKELFGPPYLKAALDAAGPLPDADLLATLTELTARTRNPELLARLRAALDGVPLRASGELGLPEAAKEAYAFAVLGFLTVHGVPGALPGCTGARRATVLGSLTPGRDGLRLPPPAPAPSRLEIVPGAQPTGT